jgi:hypothetical protein
MKAALLLAVLLQASTWSYTLVDTDGNTIFDTTGVKIIFEGSRMSPNGGRGGGTLTISGDGRGGSQIGRGDGAFTTSYANGVCTLTFAGHTITLINGGKKLVYGDQSFDLSEGKRTILVKATGPAEIQTPN